MSHCLNCGLPADKHAIVKDARRTTGTDVVPVQLICPTGLYVEAVSAEDEETPLGHRLTDDGRTAAPLYAHDL